MLRTYLLLMKQFDREGGNLILTDILDILNSGAQDNLRAEVAIFAARNLIDAIDESLHADEIGFFGKIFEFILGNANARDSYIIAKSSLFLMEEAGKILLEFKSQNSVIVSFIFDVFAKHEKLQGQAIDTLNQFCMYCKFNFSQ